MRTYLRRRRLNQLRSITTGGRVVNEPIAADNSEESEVVNESIVNDENVPVALDDDVSVEQLVNDNVDAEVIIPNIDKVDVQEEVILQDDGGDAVNLDVTPDNILPDGSKRGRIP